MASKSSEKTLMGSVIETIKTIVYALLIAGVFRTVFFQPFWIPSGSMKDTLLIGDFLFVNKMAYGYSYASCPKVIIPAVGLNLDADDFCGFLKGRDNRIMGSTPERGDVVVFRHPVSGEDYIKRLVGLPGDQIQMIQGVLHINGAAVKLEPAGDFVETFERQGPQRNTPLCKERAVGIGADCTKTRYVETLPGGVEHNVLDTFDATTPRSSLFRDVDNTGVFHVPEGNYFFMGDNRDNSIDSRVSQLARGVGFVPEENLIGRADRIIFSSAGRSMLAFWTWRGDRFFKRVE
ncbi:MAG: signal peptidase I [Planktomarina sp.]